MDNLFNDTIEQDNVKESAAIDDTVQEENVIPAEAADAPIVEVSDDQQEDQSQFRRLISGNEQKKKNLKKEIISWVATLVAAVIIALLLRSFVFIMVKVDGRSMNNTLQHENVVFVWRAGYIFDSPSRGDIIICHYPDANGEYTSDVNYVKRVIGLPGETVEIDKGAVYINGVRLVEPYVDAEVSDLGKDYKYNFTRVTLGEDEYFVMGDNRRNSKDSRYIGPIKEDQILGRSVFKVLPFDQFGQPTK